MSGMTDRELASKIGVRYAAHESCKIGAPFYAFTETELEVFAARMRGDGDPEQAVAWQRRVVHTGGGTVVSEWEDCTEADFQLKRQIDSQPKLFRTVYRALYECPQLVNVAVASDAVRELISGVRTLNRSKHHEVAGCDDGPRYWQRGEWIDWILELCDSTEAALSTQPAPSEVDTGEDLQFGPRLPSGGPVESKAKAWDDMIHLMDELSPGWSRLSKVGSWAMRRAIRAMHEAALPAPAEQVAAPIGWEPCTPEYVAKHGDCATAPRVSFEGDTRSHYHPAKRDAEQVAASVAVTPEMLDRASYAYYTGDTFPVGATPWAEHRHRVRMHDALAAAIAAAPVAPEREG